jgi:hypothetical protein
MALQGTHRGKQEHMYVNTMCTHMPVHMLEGYILVWGL